MKMRIAIASTDSFMLNALECVLSSSGEFEVVGCFAKMPSVETIALGVQPDLLLLTEEFSDEASLEAVRRLRSEHNVKVMLLFGGESAAPEAIIVFDAVQSRAAGTGPLCRRIKTVLGRGGLINQDLPGGAVGATAAGPVRPTRLSPRLYEVAEMLAQGQSNKQIGIAMAVTVATVKVYVARLLRTFDCENRTQLAMKLAAGDGNWKQG